MMRLVEDGASWQVPLNLFWCRLGAVDPAPDLAQDRSTPQTTDVWALGEVGSVGDRLPLSPPEM